MVRSPRQRIFSETPRFSPLPLTLRRTQVSLRWKPSGGSSARFARIRPTIRPPGENGCPSISKTETPNFRKRRVALIA